MSTGKIGFVGTPCRALAPSIILGRECIQYAVYAPSVSHTYRCVPLSVARCAVCLRAEIEVRRGAWSMGHAF